jgi:hypothetical protein
MKMYADKPRRDLQFQVGEWVFLKFIPHRQQSVAKRINQKLAAKFYGPFQIVVRVGETAYKLKLPNQSRIHPLFHVSLLKKAVGSYNEEEALPDDLDGEKDNTPYEPDKVLAQRKVIVHGEEVKQVLVQWRGQNKEDATWEDTVMLTSQFPHFILEDKDVLSDGGIDGNRGSTIGPSVSLNPNDSVLNQDVGPREWMVYSRRGKRVTKG